MSGRKPASLYHSLYINTLKTHTHSQIGRNSACLIFTLIFMLTHIHEQTHIVIVSTVLSRECKKEWGLPSANPYEMYKGNKKEHRNHSLGVKWFWTVCHSPHLVVISFHIPHYFFYILLVDCFPFFCRWELSVQKRGANEEVIDAYAPLEILIRKYCCGSLQNGTDSCSCLISLLFVYALWIKMDTILKMYSTQKLTVYITVQTVVDQDNIQMWCSKELLCDRKYALFHITWCVALAG